MTAKRTSIPTLPQIGSAHMTSQNFDVHGPESQALLVYTSKLFQDSPVPGSLHFNDILGVPPVGISLHASPTQTPMASVAGKAKSIIFLPNLVGESPPMFFI